MEMSWQTARESRQEGRKLYLQSSLLCYIKADQGAVKVNHQLALV